MAVSTTMRRGSDNHGYKGWMNIYLPSEVIGAPGQVLTLSGDLLVTISQELPNFGWKCQVTTTPPGSNRLRVRMGDTVTG